MNRVSNILMFLSILAARCLGCLEKDDIKSFLPTYLRPVAVFFYRAVAVMLRYLGIFGDFLLPLFWTLFMFLVFFLPYLPAYIIIIVLIYFFHYRLLLSLKSFAITLIFGTTPPLPHWNWTYSQDNTPPSNHLPSRTNSEVYAEIHRFVKGFENENRNLKQFLDFNLIRFDAQLLTLRTMIDRLGHLPPNLPLPVYHASPVASQG